jgi:hypothetical protein
MTPGADTVIVAAAAASRTEQASQKRAAAEAPSVPSSYVVWEKER